jgi:MFS family permease
VDSFLRDGKGRMLVAAMVMQYAVGGAIIPFITLFLRERGLHLGQISLVLFWCSAVLVVSPFFWGMLADRYVPLNWLFGVLNGFAVLALFAFWFQDSVLGLTVCFTLFYACFQPAPTLVNAFSFHHLNDPLSQFASLRAWGSVGWILPSGPLFVWLALSPGHGHGFIVPLTILLSLAMVGLSFVLPHTAPGAMTSRKGGLARLGYRQAVRQLFRNPNFVVILGSYFLISASFCLQAFYSPPRLADLGLNIAWIGPVQCVGVVVEVLLFRCRRSVLDRMRYADTVLVGCVVLVIRQVLFAFSDNLPLLCISYVLVGTTVVFYHIGVSIIVDALAGPEVRATAQALLVLCSSGLGPLFANAVAGRLPGIGTGQLTGVFMFGAVLASIATVLVWLRGSKLDPPKR